MASPEGLLRLYAGLVDFGKGIASGMGDTSDLLQKALGLGISPQQAKDIKKALEAARPARPIEGSQLRLPLTQPGKGSRAYSPAKSAGGDVTDIIRSEQRALPAASSAEGVSELTEQAADYGLRFQFDPEMLLRLQRQGASPQFLEQAARQARLSQVPRTVRTSRESLPSSPQAPKPEFKTQEITETLMDLRQSDPGTYRAIAQLTAPLAQRTGATQLEVMEAITGPNGNKVINFIEAGNDLPTSIRLAQGGPLVPTPGTAMAATKAPGAVVRSPGGELIDQAVEDVSVRVLDPQMLRNAAAGVQTTDMGGLLRNVPPEVLAGLGLTAGGLAAAGLSRFAGSGERTPSMPQDLNELVDRIAAPPAKPDSPTLEPPVTAEAPQVLFRDENGAPLGDGVVAPSITSDVGAVDPTRPAPVVTSGEDRESARRQMLAQADPTAAAVDRMMEPMSPERYSNIADYYRDRARYSAQPEVKRELIKYAASTVTSPEGRMDLETWARSFPGLAYEMQRRALANPAASQQSPETRTVPTVNTQMGSETEANAVGNAQATASAEVDRTQGAYDLKNATDMIPQVRLERAQELMRSFGVR